MADYEHMYYKLFNQITETIANLENETEKLKNIQLLAEEIYTVSEDRHNNHDNFIEEM